MKKKIASKVNISKAKPVKKASTVLIDSMVKLAKQPNPDEETFRLLVKASNAKVLDALRSNKDLTRGQKSELGIKEKPVVLSNEFKKMPAAEAKKKLLEFFNDWQMGNGDDEELRQFLTLPQTLRRTDLGFSTADSLKVIRAMWEDTEKEYDNIQLEDIIGWLGTKTCEIRLNPKLVSELILEVSPEFIDLIDIMPKPLQAETIDLLCKKPLGIEKYVDIITLIFNDSYLRDVLLYPLGYHSEVSDEAFNNRSNDISEWATLFLKKAKLNVSGQKELKSIMRDTNYNRNMCPNLSVEMIDVALESGITYVKHCANFDKWLESLFAARKKEKTAVIKSSMPEQIAKYICEEDTNANKVSEVMELARSLNA